MIPIELYRRIAGALVSNVLIPILRPALVRWGLSPGTADATLGAVRAVVDGVGLGLYNPDTHHLVPHDESAVP